MKKPSIPPNERKRLAQLDSLGVLDTQAEERFDRISRMAKRLFNVPIALVSLVDENRQWFKSCFGISASETSREISFCGHAILNSDVFIINNALEDNRFIDNPLVVNDPKIRFYAGCPLVVNGYRLGTLCLIDQVPREFDEQDVSALQDLASMVEHELTAVQLATMDELTGISNRRGFLMLAQSSLNYCIRNHIAVTLAYLDLDLFKEINDHYGHAKGDEILVMFADSMKATFRNSDIFARLGGDEFVLLFSNTTRDQALHAIDKFRASLAEIKIAHGYPHRVEFTCGIVEFTPSKHPTMEALLEEGDKLMYQLKH
ncbi:GGDEF domain-containing protein [Psychromonas sp. psych-6C06]|uniref:sensor domain-containing diguanylate cyclase n=1 Tax=Psychromonas sp. psych-6C06 TaxID=2058089 RepID=UPI000C338EE0|nr:sensor domain-containing diguanylate cyclase [Psychromonas sp. psych-6C06]PKF63694.1 GGDEF domain-containing protein [Psychromonas sp. psych-6C06]